MKPIVKKILLGGCVFAVLALALPSASEAERYPRASYRRSVPGSLYRGADRYNRYNLWVRGRGYSTDYLVEEYRPRFRRHPGGYVVHEYHYEYYPPSGGR